MSLFDLFRGFFGPPRGHGRDRRDPFFDSMTHEEDDDDEEDGFYFDGFHRGQRDPFDDNWRFGFSVGPDGMRFHEEPQGFGQILKEMEEIFSHFGHVGMPVLPPPQDRGETGKRGSSRNPLRDFMLKSPDSDSQREPPTEPRPEARPSEKSPVHPRSPFHGWNPRFDEIWKKGPQTFPEDERREDRDLDSAVSSGGLDQILAPPASQTPNQPRTRSFFRSVTVTKVLRPDGTVEEKRTVRDSQGKEETTVTAMQDDYSLFSKLFEGFK